MLYFLRNSWYASFTKFHSAILGIYFYAQGPVTHLDSK